MNQEHNWNSEKKELKKLSIKELQEKLQELQTEKFKMETDMMRGQGTSVTTRNYPIAKQTKPYGNLKKIKKTIAVVKTFLHVKYGASGR